MALLTAGVAACTYTDSSTGRNRTQVRTILREKLAHRRLGARLEAAGDLMDTFYSRLTEGARASAALRQAKLDLLRRRIRFGSVDVSLTHPFFWAPFKLLGTSAERQERSARTVKTLWLRVLRQCSCICCPPRLAKGVRKNDKMERTESSKLPRFPAAPLST
jgi:hypothetical protein